MPTADHPGPLVLDTHVVLWWQEGGKRLSRRVAAAVDAASSLLISPITFWEIAMLISKGRVHLDRPTSTWVADLLASEDRLAVAELSPHVAIVAGELDDFHGDPADRLIVATAMHQHATLATKDRRILRHAGSLPGLATVW